MSCRPYLILYTESNVRYAITINVKTKITKLLKENIGEKEPLQSRVRQRFLTYLIWIAIHKIKTLVHMTSPNFFKKFSLKNTVKKLKRQARDWKKIVAKHVSNEGFTCRKHNRKNSQNSTGRRQTMVRKCAKDWNGYFTREGIQKVSEHIKRCSIILMLAKCNSKPLWDTTKHSL